VWQGVLAGMIVVGAVVVALREKNPPRLTTPRFDPVAVGTTEADGWRAYYDRDFVAGFRLLLRLMRQQFGLGPLDALRATHAAVRAQMAFAPKVNDLDVACRWLSRFYAISPRRGGVTAEDLAHAELDYWVVHRRVASDDDQAPLIDAFVRLHALLFGGDATSLRRSAELRTEACNVVDRITSGRSTDIEQDWQQIREHLIAAYSHAVEASSVPATR
jgi:hypothetical protein